MAVIAPQEPDVTGLDPTYAAAESGGDSFEHDRGLLLHVSNGDGSSHTVTVVSQFPTEPGIDSDDVAVAIPAGESRFIGPFSSRVFADSENMIQVTYDDVTSVEVALLKVT